MREEKAYMVACSKAPERRVMLYAATPEKALKTRSSPSKQIFVHWITY